MNLNNLFLIANRYIINVTLFILTVYKEDLYLKGGSLINKSTGP